MSNGRVVLCVVPIFSNGDAYRGVRKMQSYRTPHQISLHPLRPLKNCNNKSKRRSDEAPMFHVLLSIRILGFQN